MCTKTGDDNQLLTKNKLYQFFWWIEGMFILNAILTHIIDYFRGTTMERFL